MNYPPPPACYTPSIPPRTRPSPLRYNHSVLHERLPPNPHSPRPRTLKLLAAARLATSERSLLTMQVAQVPVGVEASTW